MAWVLRLHPRAVAWGLGLMVAVGLAGSVYRIPIQVSDSLEPIQRALATPSLTASFAGGLNNSRSMLRPLREVRTKLLLDAGQALGGRYHAAFRGYHALAGVALILLFVWTIDARRWTEVAALAFGLAVLTGMHTFAGMFREAYPVNHFLSISLYTLGAYAIARTRGGWLADVGAVALLLIAVLTLESGVLVFVVGVAAALAGLRGISWRGLAVMALALASYAVLRVGYLGIHTAGLGEHATGFWMGVLSPAEQVARFGAHPFPLYVYNVSMAGLSVLLSQPTTGRWTVGAALLEGRLDPVFVVEMGSSILTTGLILWYACGRGASGSRRWREPDVLVFAAIVVANACLTWAYVKNEIVSTAGVFYALAAGAAMRELLSRSRVTMSVPIALALFVLGSAWAIRDVGLHFKLRHSAFVARSEWAYVLSPAHREDWPADERTRAIVSRLKQEAVSIQGPPPALMPEWAEDWFGEE